MAERGATKCLLDFSYSPPKKKQKTKKTTKLKRIYCGLILWNNNGFIAQWLLSLDSIVFYIMLTTLYNLCNSARNTSPEFQRHHKVHFNLGWKENYHSWTPVFTSRKFQHQDQTIPEVHPHRPIPQFVLQPPSIAQVACDMHPRPLTTLSWRRGTRTERELLGMLWEWTTTQGWAL